LKNIWVLSKNDEFPILESNKKRKLKFQISWLHSFPWLTYSKIKLGGFCKHCIVFSKYGGVGNQKLGELVVEPFMSFKDELKVNI